MGENARMLDLYGATGDELIVLVMAQQTALADRDRRVAAMEAEIAALHATVAQLNARIGDLVGAGSGEPPDGAVGPRGMPGLKPTQVADRPPWGWARRVHSVARRRAIPTTREVHALAR